jgi:hypothetical protein
MTDPLGFFSDDLSCGRYHEAVEQLAREEARKRKARQKQLAEYAETKGNAPTESERTTPTDERPAVRATQPARPTVTPTRRR